MKYLDSITVLLIGSGSISLIEVLNKVEPVLRFTGQTLIGIATLTYLILKIRKLWLTRKQ